MADYSYKNIVARYGEPVLRFDTDQDEKNEDPFEVAVFALDGHGGCIVFARYREDDYWSANSAERQVISYLLKEREKHI